MSCYQITTARTIPTNWRHQRFTTFYYTTKAQTAKSQPEYRVSISIHTNSYRTTFTTTNFFATTTYRSTPNVPTTSRTSATKTTIAFINRTKINSIHTKRFPKGP